MNDGVDDVFDDDDDCVDLTHLDDQQMDEEVHFGDLRGMPVRFFFFFTLDYFVCI